MHRSLAIGCVAVALGGCEAPRTEIVVRVDSEVAWGEGQALQSVQLTVRRGGPVGPVLSRRSTALGAGEGRRGLPLLVGVVASDDTLTPLWVEALGCADPNGCEADAARVAQRAVVRFVVGQTQELPLLLASACVGVICASDQRCTTRGQCEAATTAQASLRPFALPADDAAVDAPVVAELDAPVDAPAAVDRPAAVDAAVDAVVVLDRPAAPDAVAPPDVPAVVDRPPAMDLGVDSGAAPDVGRPDTGAPADTGTAPPRAAFLDRCTTATDCASGECLTTSSGARFCTKRCATTSECGTGLLCELSPTGHAARCVPDDTGLACDARTSAPCARRCIGNPTDGSHAHCTHECSSAADCPGGYGCQDAAGGVRLCVAVEEACSRDAECTTNLCLVMTGTFEGCTSRCITASDCPRRMAIAAAGSGPTQLPPYQCQVVGGQRVCVPPIQATGGDITASRPVGASCGAAPAVLCRSGVCDGATNTCIQGCTPAGGCPSGFVCRDWIDGGNTYLVCRRTNVGSGVVGATCATGADCATGLCRPGSPGYCTRYCDDRVCPTGMRCVALASAVNGTPIAMCQP